MMMRRMVHAGGIVGAGEHERARALPYDDPVAADAADTDDGVCRV